MGNLVATFFSQQIHELIFLKRRDSAWSGMEAAVYLEIVVHSPPLASATSCPYPAAACCSAWAPPAPTAHPSDWAALHFELLLAIASRIENPAERKGAHLTCRTLSGAICHSLQSLAPRKLDAAALRASFPNVSDLHLRGLTLGLRQLACLGSLACQLTSLRLSACTLAGGHSAVLALCSLSRLARLELCDLAGPSGEALDDALRGMPGLHSLRVRAGPRQGGARHASAQHTKLSLWHCFPAD